MGRDIADQSAPEKAWSWDEVFNAFVRCFSRTGKSGGGALDDKGFRNVWDAIAERKEKGHSSGLKIEQPQVTNSPAGRSLQVVRPLRPLVPRRGKG